MTPIVSVLHGHVSAETAHLSFDYPYGRTTRCVRREWVERATKGSAKGRERFAAQTTCRAFNDIYTAKIEAVGQAEADAWAREMIAKNLVRWNKPHTGIYSDLVILTQQPLEDGSGRLGISHLSLYIGSGPERFKAFREAVGAHLSDAQSARLSLFEAIDRKLNPTCWAQFEGKAVA